MYTRCPECETMFHLRVEDLRQAGGRVRCGECNHVFYGMDYLAEEPEPNVVVDATTGQLQPATGSDSGPAAAPGAWSGDASEPDDLTKPEISAIEDETDDEAESQDILFTSDDSAPAENAAEIGAAMSLLTNPDLSNVMPAAESVDHSDSESAAAEDVSTEPWDTELEELESTADVPDEADAATDADTARDAGWYMHDAPMDSDESDWNAADNAADDLDTQWDTAAAADEPDSLDDDNGDGDDFGIDDTIWEKIPGVGAIETGEDNAELAAAGHDDTGEFLTSELLASNDAQGAAAELEALNKAADEELPDAGNGAEELTEDDADEEDSDLEFNVPEAEWSTVFETSSDFGATAADAGAEADQVDTQTVPAQMPPWQFDKYRNVDLEHYDSYAGFWAICLAVLATILAGQLVHYNRDRLAAHPTYGENIRALYAFLDLPLYPRWSIEDYEIRGSEAVVGETGPDVMDIRTQIAAVGDHAVGLPVLRVVLRDRWSNPVAARNFNALEYAASEDLPADDLLQPNSSLTARLSIIDPGSGAQGYELELCVPYGNNRLECSGQAFK